MSVPIWRAAAARAAEERKRLELGAEPVADVRALVERQGALVFSTPVSGGSLSGCFALISGDTWIMVNSAQRVGRQHFTIAHEYCHSLVDRDREFVLCTKAKPPHEKFADAFAAAFLMPAESSLAFFASVIGMPLKAESVVEYCYVFGVSYRAALFRLVDLGVATSRQAEALASMSPVRVAAAMGYNLQDPAGPFMMGECDCGPSVDAFPRAYRSAAMRAFEEELISESKLAELLGVDADDLDDLLDPVEIADVPVAW